MGQHPPVTIEKNQYSTQNLQYTQNFKISPRIAKIPYEAKTLSPKERLTWYKQPIITATLTTVQRVASDAWALSPANGAAPSLEIKVLDVMRDMWRLVMSGANEWCVCCFQRYCCCVTRVHIFSFPLGQALYSDQSIFYNVSTPYMWMTKTSMHSVTFIFSLLCIFCSLMGFLTIHVYISNAQNLHKPCTIDYWLKVWV